MLVRRVSPEDVVRPGEPGVRVPVHEVVGRDRVRIRLVRGRLRLVRGRLHLVYLLGRREAVERIRREPRRKRRVRLARQEPRKRVQREPGREDRVRLLHDTAPAAVLVGVVLRCLEGRCVLPVDIFLRRRDRKARERYQNSRNRYQKPVHRYQSLSVRVQFAGMKFPSAVRM